jgi:hypothetical protein
VIVLGLLQFRLKARELIFRACRYRNMYEKTM